ATFVALARAVREAKRAGMKHVPDREIQPAIKALIESGELVQEGKEIRAAATPAQAPAPAPSAPAPWPASDRRPGMAKQQPSTADLSIPKHLLETATIVVRRHLDKHHQATFIELAKAIRSAKQSGGIIIDDEQIDAVIKALIACGDLVQSGDGTIVFTPSPVPAALLARVNDVLWAHLKVVGHSSFDALAEVVRAAKQSGSIDIDDQQIKPAIRHLLISEVLIGTTDGPISHDNHHVVVNGKRYYVDWIGSLDLSNQGIHDLAEIEGLDRVAGILKELDLSHNRLTNIDALAPCTKLESLDVSNNQITCIDVIKHFPCLAEINANDNQITRIPPPSTFLHLKKLLRFYVACNKITSLPPLDEFITLGPEGEGRDFSFGYNDISSVTISKNIVVGYLGFHENKITDSSWIWKIWLDTYEKSSPFDCITIDPNPFTPSARNDVDRYYDEIMENERGYANMPRE
ncbi:MAG: leucine-rich repeat domain-containing protein, partial [Candidatus Sigynarchaeota archaeon]